MNILWITSIIFPFPSKVLGFPPPVVGGWTFSFVNFLASQSNINLVVASTYPGIETRIIDEENIRYYLFPVKNVRSNRAYQKKLEPLWNELCAEIKPDIVHIHGTEYTGGLSCMRACPSLNYIISLQGLLSVIHRYYFSGISRKEILRHTTFRDLVKGETLFQLKTKFKKRARYEQEYLQRTKNVIGRTNWDHVHVKNINPTLDYHFCNEVLRNEFYTSENWDINKKNSYSIFLSQANYPIKGLHQLIKAVSKLKDEFPQIQIRIAGSNYVRNKSLVEKMKLIGYGSYILSLLKKNKLENHFTFLGYLNASQMVIEYQNAHLFLCPSSIENSPNSLGEAQMIGTPSIGAYVGGIPDMIEDNVTGLLYRFEEVEMLAYNIRRIFNDDKLALKLSELGRNVSQVRHNRNQIIDNTIRIYTSIYKGE